MPAVSDAVEESRQLRVQAKRTRAEARQTRLECARVIAILRDKRRQQRAENDRLMAAAKPNDTWNRLR